MAAASGRCARCECWLGDAFDSADHACQVKPSKAHGESRRIGIARDVDVPVVKAGRPNVTIVGRGDRDAE